MSDSQQPVRRIRWIFAVLLTAAVAFRTWFVTTIPLSGDETYHWQWSRHLEFGYHDHPPMTAYAIRLSTALFGRSTEFTVRLPAILLLAGTAIVSYLMARFVSRRLGSGEEVAERAGLMAGCLVIVLPLHAGMAVYMSTDPPLVFFGTLTLYALCRAFSGGGWPAWLAVGAAMGVALQSKFLAGFLLPAAGLYMIVDRSQWHWWRKPHPYVAGVLALVIVAPFLIWNAVNDWPTFAFNFHRRRTTAFVPAHLPEYLAAQIGLVITPVLAVIGVEACRRLHRTADPRGARLPLLLVLSSAVPLLYFLQVSLRRQIGLHWTALGWIPMIVLIGVGWQAAFPRLSQSGRRRLLTWALAFPAVLIVMAHLVVHTPASWLESRSWQFPLVKKPIPVTVHAERFGWPELGQWVARVRSEMLATRAHTPPRGVFVIAHGYSLASNVAFYTPGQIETHLWSPVRACGESYRRWDRFEEMKGMAAVFVADPKIRMEHALPVLREHFASVGEVETLPIVVSGHEVRQFHLVRCLAFDGRTPEFNR